MYRKKSKEIEDLLNASPGYPVRRYPTGKSVPSPDFAQKGTIRRLSNAHLNIPLRKAGDNPAWLS